MRSKTGTSGHERCTRVFSGVLLLAILALPSIVSSQTSVTGAFSGQVVDVSTNVPLAGAMVVFTNQDTMVPTARRTDSAGRFLQSLLPPGRYTIEVRAAGYVTFSMTASLFATMINEVPSPIRLSREVVQPVPASAPAPFPVPTPKTIAPKFDSRQLIQTEPVKTWPAGSKRWALVIGVDEYYDRQITPLRGATNDARTLAAALNRYAGFPAEQIILLANDQPDERKPTRSNILKYLSNLRGGLVPRDGLLLVSFAGHGIERENRSYLLPADALWSNDIALLEDTAINVERVRDSIKKTEVGQVVLILDNCRNDPSAGRGGGDNRLTEGFRNSFDFDVRNHEVQAFVTLLATDVGQRAYEYSEKEQGYFTWTLIEGLKGGAANQNGEITLANLVKYLQDRVPKYVHRDLGNDKQQRPISHVEGYRADELVIAISPPPSTPN